MKKTYAAEQQIPEIPFDVAEWGDAPLPWPEGLFADDAELKTATSKASALPRSAPKPK